jgi:hypothetical protein
VVMGEASAQANIDRITGYMDANAKLMDNQA